MTTQLPQIPVGLGEIWIIQRSRNTQLQFNDILDTEPKRFRFFSDSAQLQEALMQSLPAAIIWLEAITQHEIELLKLPPQTLLFVRPTSNREYLAFGDVLLDPKNQQVHFGETTRTLSTLESALLTQLMTEPNKPRSRQHLLKTIWEGVSVTPRTIDAHMAKLRRKLRGSMLRIESVYGLGYYVSLPQPASKPHTDESSLLPFSHHIKAPEQTLPLEAQDEAW